MLFYSTIYIGEFYKRSVPPAPSADAQIALDAEATRLGARALFYSAVIALGANLILPLFVYETEEKGAGKKCAKMIRIPDVLRVHLITLWAASHFIFAACMFATLYAVHAFIFKITDTTVASQIVSGGRHLSFWSLGSLGP